MPPPDCGAGDAQGSGARVSPPTPRVEQFVALPPPALGAADPLPPPLEAADPLPPALEVVIVGLETVAVPHAAARTTAPAAVRITDTGRRACHALLSPAFRRIHPISPPPHGCDRYGHEPIFRQYKSRDQRSAPVDCAIGCDWKEVGAAQGHLCQLQCPRERFVFVSPPARSDRQIATVPAFPGLE